MKVKVLTANLMVDYKKVAQGEIVELTNDVANRFIKAGLVEMSEKKDCLEPLIVTIDGVEVDLNNLTAKELGELSVKYDLGINQESKEKKDGFAQRIFNAVNEKNKE